MARNHPDSRGKVEQGRDSSLFSRLDPVTGADLDSAPFVRGRVLHQGDQPAGHEAPGADRLAGACHLTDLDHPARGDDLDTAPRPGRHDLEGLNPLARVDQGLDAITFHVANVTPSRSRGVPENQPTPSVC